METSFQIEFCGVATSGDGGPRIVGFRGVAGSVRVTWGSYGPRSLLLLNNFPRKLAVLRTIEVPVGPVRFECPEVKSIQPLKVEVPAAMAGLDYASSPVQLKERGLLSGNSLNQGRLAVDV